jgi:hypothetical protein
LQQIQALGQRIELFEKLQIECSIMDPLKIPLHSNVRWGTAFNMLNRSYQLRQVCIPYHSRKYQVNNHSLLMSSAYRRPALHPYYKIAYIELAWGGAKEQEAEYEAGNFESKNWQDEARKILEKTVSNITLHPRAPPNVLLILQMERYWKTRPNTTSMTNKPSPAVTAERTEDSVISEFNRHRLTLVSQEQDGGLAFSTG